MIRIQADLRRHELFVEGHGGGKKGQDIVCAAVSVLVLTLAERCRRMWADDRRVYREPVIELQDGRAYIKAEATWSGIYALDATFETVFLGLRRTAEKYPDKIKFVGV